MREDQAFALVVFLPSAHRRGAGNTRTNDRHRRRRAGRGRAGVTVTALNTATNVATEAVTNASGVFTIQQLVPGPSRSPRAAGFKTFVREGITLRTAETVTINVQLEVGGVEETVTVSAASHQIESNESTIAQTIENKRISELPLNGRQVYMLMQLTAGTLFTQTTFGATGFSGTRAWDVNGSLSVHGSRTGNNEFLMDGAPSSGTGGGTGNWNYAPPVDAIEEFKIGTSSVDASYRPHERRRDQHDAALGTNQFRGSGIILHRGTWLDSNQIQNIRNNISNKGHKYYNAEGMVSGPIRQQQDVLHGRLPGLLREHSVPGDADGPDRGAAARRLLADDHRQRHADHHLRSGDDELQRELEHVHAAAVPGQRHPAESLEPDRRGARAAHSQGRTRRRATSRGRATSSAPRTSAGIATTRTSPASTTSSARITGCRSPTPATGASSSATRTPCPNRRSGATTTRPTATTTW